MYTTPKSGQVAPGSAAPTLHLGTYRRAIMAVLADEVFTPEERLRANHSVYECVCGQKLALWLQNVTRVRDEREAKSLAYFAQALAKGQELVGSQPTVWATAAQCDEIFALASLPCFTKGEKTSALRGLVTLTQQDAVQEIGALYATAWRRGCLPLHPENGAASPTRLAQA